MLRCNSFLLVDVWSPVTSSLCKESFCFLILGSSSLMKRPSANFRCRRLAIVGRQYFKVLIFLPFVWSSVVLPFHQCTSLCTSYVMIDEVDDVAWIFSVDFFLLLSSRQTASFDIQYIKYCRVLYQIHFFFDEHFCGIITPNFEWIYWCTIFFSFRFFKNHPKIKIWYRLMRNKKGMNSLCKHLICFILCSCVYRVRTIAMKYNLQSSRDLESFEGSTTSLWDCAIPGQLWEIFRIPMIWEFKIVNSKKIKLKKKITWNWMRPGQTIFEILKNTPSPFKMLFRIRAND